MPVNKLVSFLGTVDISRPRLRLKFASHMLCQIWPWEHNRLNSLAPHPCNWWQAGQSVAVNFICIQLKEANTTQLGRPPDRPARPPTAEQKQMKRDANGRKRGHQSLLAIGPVGILLYTTPPPQPTYEIWLGNIKHRNILRSATDDLVKSPPF